MLKSSKIIRNAYNLILNIKRRRLMSDEVIGRMCQARYNGGYIIGKIVKNDFKSGLCTIETKEIGTIKAKASRVKLIDKDL